MRLRVRVRVCVYVHVRVRVRVVCVGTREGCVWEGGGGLANVLGRETLLGGFGYIHTHTHTHTLTYVAPPELYSEVPGAPGIFVAVTNAQNAGMRVRTCLFPKQCLH